MVMPTRKPRRESKRHNTLEYRITLTPLAAARLSKCGRNEISTMNTNRYIVIVGLGALVSLVGCDMENERGTTATPSTNVRTETTQTGTDVNRTGATDASRTSTDADNTRRNEIDRKTDTKTPFDQSESSADIKVTAEIRRAIIDDDSMSVNAQNIKIMTDKAGVVTLRGVVHSQAEKSSIEAKAKAVAGVTRVDNQLEIKAN